MGRSERERRQAAQARLQAAGITPPRRSGARRGLAIAGIVLAAALAVGAYLAWQNYSAPVEPAYAVARDGVVVTAGNPAAPVTVDVYEDYLCPACKQFERIYGDEITAALNDGKVKVNYHHIAILDDRSNPPGYSTRAGNAALCAADAGIFPAFHARLYTDQPGEGAGRTVEELTAWGTELGATGDFAGCVARQENTRGIADATAAAAADPAAAPGGRFGTPTVLVNRTKIDVNDSAWLSKAAG
ncbi:thioredoxin domain-containing protein [Pseudonocardia sp. C8]|uniref:DsbA family protein n=1 Tax=Pseudonocardia sp. C8 TaxID=2762759 RepID=UPI0016432C06|nr:thioredoxin domain-containing protein [Pseudonocardia sp. C8]MBC3190301.1 thioredoxin domain-containing protein [Pseudonocardia sp. C8]